MNLETCSVTQLCLRINSITMWDVSSANPNQCRSCTFCQFRCPPRRLYLVGAPLQTSKRLNCKVEQEQHLWIKQYRAQVYKMICYDIFNHSCIYFSMSIKINIFICILGCLYCIKLEKICNLHTISKLNFY